MENPLEPFINILRDARSGIGLSAEWIISQPKALLYASLIAVVAISFCSIVRRNCTRSLLSRPRSPDPEQFQHGSSKEKSPSQFKAPQRPQGVWFPVDFKRPAASPYPDWDVRTTKPLPYRPFRHGPYHITMGLRTMKWDEWIELDNHFPKYHADKAKRIEERGSKCSKTSPEAFDGACELLEEL